MPGDPMNPEHLKEQQEAIEAASQKLESGKHQLRSTHRPGWLAPIALAAAVIVPVWLYRTDHQQSREAAINTEIQALHVSTVKQQDEIASVLNDLARRDKGNEKLEDQQQAQAVQTGVVLGDLREQIAHISQLEQQVRELILGSAEEKREIEQLKIDNKVLQEQVAANDNAQAKQADLIRDLQRTKQDKNKQTLPKRGFFSLFQK